MLNREIPATIKIPHEDEDQVQQQAKTKYLAEESCKKMPAIVDNCPVFSQKRYQLIVQIQGFLKNGCSYREIARRLGVGRNTIAKYRSGDPLNLYQTGIQKGKLSPYHNEI